MELCKNLRFIFANNSYAIAGSFFLIIASTSSITFKQKEYSLFSKFFVTYHTVI